GHFAAPAADDTLRRSVSPPPILEGPMPEPSIDHVQTTVSSAAPTRGGRSISVKLPLLIGLLLAGVIGIYSWAAYHELRRSAVTVASARLQTVTDQLADLLAASGNQFRVMANELAARPEIGAFLQHPNDSS